MTYRNHSLIGIMAIVLLTTACSEGKQKPHGDAAKYKTMVVGSTDQTLNQEYPARLAGRQIVEVRPQVSGHITKICIREGEQVRQGQTLFIIDQVPYQAALQVAVAGVKSAEAKLATAQMNLESEQRLKDNQVVGDFSVQTTQNTLQEARAALALAKAQEVNARNNLSYTVVKSPVSGSASMIPWHVGALVSSTSSEPLVTVADDHEVQAYFSVTEQQAILLTEQFGSLEGFIKGAPAVSLKLPTGTVYDEPGHITAMSGVVDEQTGAVTLRATFPNGRRLLRNGGTGTVIVPTVLKGCIVVPQEATYELQNRKFVYRVISGKTKSTPIEVMKQNDGQRYIVTSGLSVGDTIVAEGAGLLKDDIIIK